MYDHAVMTSYQSVAGDRELLDAFFTVTLRGGGRDPSFAAGSRASFRTYGGIGDAVTSSGYPVNFCVVEHFLLDFVSHRFISFQ